MDGAVPASLAWIDRLIRFDTTSRNSNLGLIETVRDHFAAQGLVTWLTTDDGGGKANLFATLPAGDGRTTGGLVLSGHTDVVPVDGQDWSSDPFAPEIRDGKLYGRGSADMKGFIGVAITQLAAMKAAPLSAPIHFALSYDEEVGCIGAPRMLAHMQAKGIAPDRCIVGEPTNMEVVVAHKGVNAYTCTVHGRAAHSSLTPSGVNAIEYAARLINRIRETAEGFRRDGPFDPAFDVPFTTAQTGTIRGGTAINVVPQTCEFAFEFRNLPTVDPGAIMREVRRFAAEDLVPQMRAVSSEADIRFEPMAVVPALEAAEEAAVTRLVRGLTGDRAVRKVAYGAEAGQFQAAGVPAVLCGPGDIRPAHRPDEYVSLEQIARCEAFFDSLIPGLRR